MRLYNFIWNDFFSWLLEIVKPAYGGSVDRESYERIIDSFEKLMKILHPFMPFITEEIYQRLRAREEGDFVGLGQWPSDRADRKSTRLNSSHVARSYSGLWFISKRFDNSSR